MGITKAMYRTSATARGGRDGQVRTEDGALEVDLATPAELGGSGGAGTNPEQLFAAGYAACLHSTVQNVATGYGVELGSSELRVAVSLGPTGRGGMGLAVEVDLVAPEVDPAEAGRLLRRAHQFCPYSRAIQGNVEVSLRAQGAPVPA